MAESNDQWSEIEINQGLKQIPTLMASQNEKVVNLRHALEGLKLTRKALAAAVKLEYAENSEKEPTATVLNAYADKKCEPLDRQILDADRELQLAVVRFDELKDKWDGIRKAANFQIEEYRRQGDAVSNHGRGW